jgi:hypothetical protein
VFGLDPANSEAGALKKRIEAVISERRISEENERAREAISEAWRLFEGGQQKAAVEFLEAHKPAHSDVKAALSQLLARAEIDRRRIEAEQQEQARVKASKLARAQQQLDSGAFELALQTIDEGLAIDAGNQEALALRDRVVAAMAAKGNAEQEARVRGEEEPRGSFEPTIRFERDEVARRLQAIAEARRLIEELLSIGRLDEAEQALVDAEHVVGAEELHEIRQRLSRERADADRARRSGRRR